MRICFYLILFLAMSMTQSMFAQSMFGETQLTVQTTNALFELKQVKIKIHFHDRELKKSNRIVKFARIYPNQEHAGSFRLIFSKIQLPDQQKISNGTLDFQFQNPFNNQTRLIQIRLESLNDIFDCNGAKFALDEYEWQKAQIETTAGKWLKAYRYELLDSSSSTYQELSKKGIQRQIRIFNSLY